MGLNNFIFNHSYHLLTVKDCTSPLDVLAFEGSESLSEPFKYRIEFTSIDKSIYQDAMLMKSASLTLQAPVEHSFGRIYKEPVRFILGVVTSFERLGTSKDESRYVLTLEPRLSLLSRSHHNAIYQYMSVPQIVEKILRERHNMRGQDFLFSLSNEYPAREQVMQYKETDLQFICRLLSEEGIWFKFTSDKRLSIDVVEFYDSRQGYGLDGNGITLPGLPLSGLHSNGEDSVWNMGHKSNVVEQSVTLNDYNYRQAEENLNTDQNITIDDSTTYGQAYHYGDNYLTQGNDYDRFPEVGSGAFYARLRHERYLNNQTLLSGTSSCPTLTLGKVLKVIEGENIDPEFTQGVLVTHITTSARRDQGFEVQFQGIPDHSEICFRSPLIERPVMAGTIPARVSSTKGSDLYGHIDKYGRYKVNFMFDKDSWPQGNESLWVRQSRPYAGDTYGLHLPLIVGTEVAIGFEDGNPDRPYIAGVLHDSKNPDHVTINNYKRNVLRTPSNNKIRLDDSRGQEHVKISTEYGGKTQLNLGHLVDHEKQNRGEGFELRTDAWGAIRAHKGIFISADGQSQAQGEVLEMSPAMTHLTNAKNQTQDISDSAESAKANPADLQAQIDLLQNQLTDLQKSVLLMSAPDGVGITSGKSLQVSSGESLITSAGKNASMSVAKNFFVGVGNSLSVFVRKLGIKLIANQGAVNIQAQNDLMELMARKEIRIVSTEDEIHIIADKKLVLNGGGSYMQLDAHSVKVATVGSFITNASHFERGMGEQNKSTYQKLPPISQSSYTAMTSSGAVMMETCNCGRGGVCKIHG